MNSPAFDNYITLLKQQPGQNVEMMCYKDKTWCSESFQCTNTDCDRNLSPDEIENAVTWWGNFDFPVSYRYFRTDYCGFVELKQEVGFENPI